MALTVTSVRRGDVAGNQRKTVSTATFDNSYVTGGLALTPTQLGLAQVQDATVKVLTPGGAVVSVVYDKTNSKLKANTISAEVANAVDLSAVQVQIHSWGY